LRAFPWHVGTKLSPLVEVPHPSVAAKDFELRARQGTKLGGTDVGVDVSQRTHPGDDCRGGRLRKAVPQRYFGKAVDWDAEVSRDGLDTFPNLLLAVAAEIAVAPVTLGQRLTRAS